MLYNNTTVKGTWVDVQNMTEISNKHGRIVNIVSLAFPHPGVAAAAQDARNKILQPAELGVRCCQNFSIDFANDALGPRSV